MEKIRKGLKLRLTRMMSKNDDSTYEGYISRVYTKKCIFIVTKSNYPLIGEGSQVTFIIDGLQSRIDNDENCSVVN